MMTIATLAMDEALPKSERDSPKKAKEMRGSNRDEEGKEGKRMDADEGENQGRRKRRNEERRERVN